ncbi:MAG TPA: DUF3857 and transglutaminase domain-containing protein [Thermoanaerobaculia bacterium]|nr:DUF3857 and transglutaminase domain-containing protein [Thermoanaerobaculia bacterium]
MRLSVLFALVLCLITTPLLHAGSNDDFHDATPEELAMKSVDWAPGAPAVILDWQSHHDDEKSFVTEYLRIKILSSEGKKYGDVELLFVPGYSWLKDIKARTIRPDGTAVPFTGKIYDKLIMRAGGVKLLQKTLSLPEVAPGSIVEYRYTRTWRSDRLMTNSWDLQREIPILHADIWVQPYTQGQISSFFTVRRWPKDRAPKRVGNHFEMALDKQPALEAEPLAPPKEELTPSVQFFYASEKIDLEKYWTETGKSFADYAESFIGDRRGIKKAAADLTAGATTDEEKLRRIYAKVQQLRNLTFEADKTEQEEKREKLHDNRHIEDVLTNGYGYRVELNRLFAGLARAAGFDASMVRVSQRDEAFFAQQLPDADQLLTEVVLVKNGDQERWFDPGTPHNAFGLLSWENTYVMAMKLVKKSGGTWVTTPEQGPELAITKRTADLHVDGDVLKGTATVTFTGQAALSRRLAAHTHDEAENRKSLEDDIKGWFPDGSTVKLTKISSLTASDEPLTLDVDLELANLGTVAGSRALLPLSVFAASQKNPLSAEQRKNAVYFNYMRQTEDHVTLHLPEGYVVESVPKGLKLDIGGALYTADWKQNGGVVTLDRKMAMKTLVVDAANYRVIRSFYARTGTADQDALVLKKAAQ